jgi:peroxiredoxin
MTLQRPAPPPLPSGLPAPVDDGAAGHLPGAEIPHVRLESTTGGAVDLAEEAVAGLVLYVFPKIGVPGEPTPEGWDAVPGARGCTQQTCAFRDLHAEIAAAGYRVAGLSAQPVDEQRGAHETWRLPFPLVADPGRELGSALRLPTFEAAGMTLYRRTTLVARGGRIVKVFYPVFPPDENAAEVLAWIAGGDAG